MTSRTSLLVALSLLAFAGCECGPQTRKRFPKIEVLDDMGNARTMVEFGQTQLNFTGTKQLRVRNAGATDLTISKAEFDKNLFGITTPIPASIAVGEELQLVLTFKPTVADQRVTGQVTFTTDDPDKPTVVVSLAGTGVTATAVLQPTSINFGEVYLGESKTLMLSLTNAGSNELPVTAATLVMADGVTANLMPLVKTLMGGETVTVSLTYAPTQAQVLMGSVQIVMPEGIGTKTVPVLGSGIRAIPKLCFKFDDSPFESCTDGTAGMNLDVRFGSWCDGRVYPSDAGLRCELDGGVIGDSRSGKMYVRNDGNTPVSYSMQVNAGTPSRCDGGASVDFLFANAPATADGGTPASWMVATTKLPMQVMDPKPWETAPVAVVYRPRSACRGGDDSDLATVLWTRQGEPANSMRRPSSMVATLTGASLLSEPVPNPVTFTGNSPLPQSVSLVSNTGDGPMRLTGAEFWQSNDGGLVPTDRCASVVGGPCQYFVWSTPPTFPVLLEGTNVPGGRVNKVLGQIAYGFIDDAGMPAVPPQEQRVFVIVDTTDPYTPKVVVPVTGRLQ